MHSIARRWTRTVPGLLTVLLLLAAMGLGAPCALAQEEAEPPAPKEEEKPPEEEAPAEEGEPSAPREEPGPDKDPAPEPAPPKVKVITIPEKVVYIEKKPKKSLLVLQPRALSYSVIEERFRVGASGSKGTNIEPDDDLGMDNVLFLSPAVNLELNFKIFGLLARFHFSYTASTLHGLYQIGRPITFSRTTFPVGTVVGSQFTHRRVTVRYFQEIIASDLFDVDVALGADYFYFRNILDAPTLAREKDVTESAIPVIGARGFYKPFDWGKTFLRLDGFYWNLGRETGMTGILETSLGVSIHISGNLGFAVEFAVEWISIRKGRPARVEVDCVTYGPRISVYAKL
jgi:hypothetical protein